MGSIIMLNILVTGSKGQLGMELQEISANYQYKFFFTDRAMLDICNSQAVNKFLTENKVNIIINCAAYTAVDKAESEQDIADQINHLAVQNLAALAKEMDITLIHISTDYVYNGQNYKPYIETDTTSPTSIYGTTKLAGENAIIKQNLASYVIIRTSWVYSYYGNNFVKTMIKLGKDRDSLNVIFDQVGTPTYAKDLAETILTILPQINNSNSGIYNYSNEGVTSWYDFACAIMEHEAIPCKVFPIETRDYPTPATRPHYSLLNKTKLKQTFNITIPYWKDSLHECLIKLRNK